VTGCRWADRSPPSPLMAAKKRTNRHPLKKDVPPFRSTERWAHFRFSVIGALLAAPPARGQLQAQLQSLADKTWRHPIGGHGFTLGFSTIERWYQKASAAKAGPVEVLKRKIRSDQGQHPALSVALIPQLASAQVPVSGPSRRQRSSRYSSPRSMI
jgi:hypothetical protein